MAPFNEMDQGFAAAFSAAQKAADGVNSFGIWYAFFAERLYIQSHQRLPGSDRTKRLRKKRKTRVLCWMERELRKCTMILD